MAASPQLPETQTLKVNGRPSDFRQETADIIYEQLIEGKGLRAILRDNEGMPSLATVFNWLNKHKGFLEQYTQARKIQAEMMADEIAGISDEVPTCEVPDPDGGVSIRIDSAGVNRNRLRVDTRKWIASKLLPKVYGEKLEVETNQPIVQINIVAPAVEPRHNPADLKPEFDVIEGK